MTDYYVIVMLFSWEKRAEEFQALEQKKNHEIFIFKQILYLCCYFLKKSAMHGNSIHVI